MLRLGPLVLASLVVMMVMWQSGSAATSGLFQSSPVQTPVVTTATATVEVQLTATSTQQATVAPSPGATGTTETSTAAPTESVAPLETPTESAPTETASPTETEVPTEPSPTSRPAASATSSTGESDATADDNQRYPEGASNLRFEWGMLFDSLALFFSYAWLFCGILLFIAVPLAFFFLWRASDRRKEVDQEEEG